MSEHSAEEKPAKRNSAVYEAVAVIGNSHEVEDSDVISHSNGNKGYRTMFGLLDFKDPEANGYVLLGASRGFAIVTGVLFVTLAAQSLANKLADCEGKVSFGGFTLRDSSVISFTQTIEAVCTMLICPIFGAMTDQSNHRKGIYWFVQFGWGFMAFAQLLMFLIAGRDSGEVVLLLLLISITAQAVFYELGYIVHFSFLPEVGKGDDELVSEISSKYYVLLNTFQVLCVILAQGANIMINLFAGDTDQTDSEGEIIPSYDEFDSVVFALTFTVLTCWLYTYLGLRKIQSRPAAETLEGKPSGNILTAGFKRSFKTISMIYKTYPQVLIFLGGFMCMMATLSSLVSLVTVYLNKQLGIAPSFIPFIVLLSVLMTVPGAALGNKLKSRIPIRKLMIFIALGWFAVAALQPLLLQGRPKTEEELAADMADSNSTDIDAVITTPYSTPLNCSALDDSVLDVARTYSTLELILAFFFSSLTGVLIGLAYPVAAAFYSMIIPGGQEAEFFGVRTFLFKVAAFAPPLIYTTINESTGRLDLAFVALAPFFLIAAVCFWFVNMEKAQADVLHTLHLRHADDKRIAKTEEIVSQTSRSVEHLPSF